MMKVRPVPLLLDTSNIKVIKNKIVNMDETKRRKWAEKLLIFYYELNNRLCKITTKRASKMGSRR